MAGLLQTIGAKLAEPVDVASLVVFRIAFGVLMAWECYQYLVLGFVRDKYILPPTLIPWAGFEWVARWPGDGLYYHFYALAALAACIAAGLAYRLACVLFCLGITYVFLLSQVHFQNHFYLICLTSLLLAFIPAHRSLSVDARLRPALRSETVPSWGVWLLRGQLGVVYFYGGVAKLNADWLQGYPMRLWLPEEAALPLVGMLFEQAWVAVLMSWSGVFIDLLAFPALLWRRTRPIAFAILVTFHLWNSQLFTIGIFPWLAMAVTTIFFDPHWPRRVFNWPRRGPDSHLPAPGWTPARRAGAVLACVYFAIQLLMPLRHHLYPGNPGWTGAGHYFAWRMMLIDIHGLLTYELVDSETGRAWTVDPRAELGDFQYKRLAGSAPMIQLYAKRLARLAGSGTDRTVEVRARSLASLNGRRPQPLVDPRVDLAAEPVPVFGPAPWIVPLEHPLDTSWLDAAEGS